MQEETYDFPLSEDVNIKQRFKKVPKSPNHPIGVEFAVMGLVRQNDVFDEVIRVDNSPHKGQPGTHIHYLDRKSGKDVVQNPDILNPEQAYDFVEEYLRKNYTALIPSS